MYAYNLGVQFDAVVERNAEKVVLQFEDGQKLNYAQLNRRANRLARYLLAIGVEKKDVVAISGKKCVHTYAGMVACLKIGAVYTIFDPDSPPERLKKILVTAEPKAIILDSAQKEKYAGIIESAKILLVNTETHAAERIQPLDSSNLAETKSVTGENPAYLMFTSGSTGFPKGAVMTHQNVINFIAWSTDSYAITPDDVLTNVNPMFFDNSVFDFYSSVFSGASLVPFSKQTVTDPRALVDRIDACKCSLWFSVPTLLLFLQTMKALSRDRFKHITRIIFGGEGYPKARLKQLFDLYSDRMDIFNVYGPTECTCICSSYKISADDFGDLQGYPPLGHLVPNFSYLILDENQRKVADNELGELCLMGPNVGKGYYRDPQRTTENFIRNPYNQNYTEIMYKTGDLVRFNPSDGKLYIAGRADNQIKHMGYRIELEEIENALCRLENVSQAAALHGFARGLSRIVAVVSTGHELDESRIKTSLRTLIPDYMVPSEIHFTDELPRNPNGKVDRRKLHEHYFAQG